MRYQEITETIYRDYPVSGFELPIEHVGFYDEPTGYGDELWDADELINDLRTNGQQNPIEVGRSRHELQQKNDLTVYCFNGNHRLAACRKLGLQMILCVNSDAEDAKPLTRQEIITLGGIL